MNTAALTATSHLCQSAQSSTASLSLTLLLLPRVFPSLSYLDGFCPNKYCTCMNHTPLYWINHEWLLTVEINEMKMKHSIGSDREGSWCWRQVGFAAASSCTVWSKGRKENGPGGLHHNFSQLLSCVCALLNNPETVFTLHCMYQRLHRSIKGISSM